MWWGARAGALRRKFISDRGPLTAPFPTFDGLLEQGPAVSGPRLARSSAGPSGRYADLRHALAGGRHRKLARGACVGDRRAASPGQVDVVMVRRSFRAAAALEPNACGGHARGATIAARQQGIAFVAAGDLFRGRRSMRRRADGQSPVDSEHNARVFQLLELRGNLTRFERITPPTASGGPFSASGPRRTYAGCGTPRTGRGRTRTGRWGAKDFCPTAQR